VSLNPIYFSYIVFPDELVKYRKFEISRRDLGRGILGLVGLEEKMETNEIRLLSSIDGFGDE
jgi:hypothetical protein